MKNVADFKFSDARATDRAFPMNQLGPYHQCAI